MGLADGRFDDFKGLFDREISKASIQENCKNFAVEEFKRFYGIGRTILESVLPNEESVGERLYSHILLRTVFENFFWLLYIFDGTDEALWFERFDKRMNGFKHEYRKLYNESALPHKSELPTPDPAWKTLPQAPKVKSLLEELRTLRG